MLEEITNVDDLIEKIDRVESPVQLISALNDPLLRKYLLLASRGDASSEIRRIELWLSRFFEDELEHVREGSIASAELTEILQGVKALTELRPTIRDIVLQFVHHYLPEWDGLTNVDAIFNLLAYVPMADFDRIKDRWLQPLETAIIASHPNAPNVLLTFYTQLTRNWMMSLSRMQRAELQASKAQDAYDRLLDHISIIALAALCASADNVAASEVVRHYNSTVVARASLGALTPNPLPVVVPPAHVVYCVAFNGASSDLSGLCSMLATTKRAFAESIGKSGTHTKESTNLFNGYLMDIRTSSGVHAA